MNVNISNEFNFSVVHGAMNRSGSLAHGAMNRSGSLAKLT